MPTYKRHLCGVPGMPLQNLWVGISPVLVMAREKVGYPIQKPNALMHKLSFDHIIPKSKGGTVRGSHVFGQVAKVYSRGKRRHRNGSKKAQIFV